MTDFADNFFLNPYLYFGSHNQMPSFIHILSWIMKMVARILPGREYQTQMWSICIKRGGWQEYQEHSLSPYLDHTTSEDNRLKRVCNQGNEEPMLFLLYIVHISKGIKPEHQVLLCKSDNVILHRCFLEKISSR